MHEEHKDVSPPKRRKRHVSRSSDVERNAVGDSAASRKNDGEGAAGEHGAPAAESHVDPTAGGNAEHIKDPDRPAPDDAATPEAADCLTAVDRPVTNDDDRLEPTPPGPTITHGVHLSGDTTTGPGASSAEAPRQAHLHPPSGPARVPTPRCGLGPRR